MSENKESAVVMGTLYDLNKGAMAQMTSLDIREIMEQQDENLTNFFSKGQYFMLLCNDIRDYTVFNLTTGSKIANAKEELYTCLSNRGELLGLDPTEDGVAFEIWLRMKTEDGEDHIFVYYMFPYDEAVLHC